VSTSPHVRQRRPAQPILLHAEPSSPVLHYRQSSLAIAGYEVLVAVVTKCTVGFEVLTAAVTESSIFWDITQCSTLKVNRRFGGTCRLHLQGRRIRQARNQREECSTACCLLHFRWTTRTYIPEDITLHEVYCLLGCDDVESGRTRLPNFKLLRGRLILRHLHAGPVIFHLIKQNHAFKPCGEAFS
jgi:hypothetical protein